MLNAFSHSRSQIQGIASRLNKTFNLDARSSAASSSTGDDTGTAASSLPSSVSASKERPDVAAGGVFAGSGAGFGGFPGPTPAAIAPPPGHAKATGRAMGTIHAGHSRQASGQSQQSGAAAAPPPPTQAQQNHAMNVQAILGQTRKKKLTVFRDSRADVDPRQVVNKLLLASLESDQKRDAEARRQETGEDGSDSGREANGATSTEQSSLAGSRKASSLFGADPETAAAPPAQHQLPEDVVKKNNDAYLKKYFGDLFPEKQPQPHQAPAQQQGYR